MTAPKISICIPTYNRANYLRECLESIISQFEDKEIREQVEVVISDNASTDRTADVIAEFQQRFSNIKYYKNETNIGFDRNILNAVEKSSGKYCLIFGDDDSFFPNCFSTVIQKIEVLQAPYFMINCWGYNHELTEPAMPHPNRQLTKDKKYTTLDEFVRSIDKYIDIVGNFGGMSGQVFLRKNWIDFDKKEEYLGTQTIHLFILLSVFKNQPFALLSEPLVKTRNDNMRWNTFPGLEVNAKRSEMTAKATLWISDLYSLNLSPAKVRAYFKTRVYWISLKESVKKTLFKLGLRKN